MEQTPTKPNREEIAHLVKSNAFPPIRFEHNTCSPSAWICHLIQGEIVKLVYVRGGGGIVHVSLEVKI